MASVMLPNQLGVSQETPGDVVPSQVHLHFLDGLRGIMALYVVFHRRPVYRADSAAQRCARFCERSATAPV